MKQSLQLKFSQHLALTPQLQQSIRLLQLSSQELNQELEGLLQSHPMLELADKATEITVRIISNTLAAAAGKSITPATTTMAISAIRKWRPSRCANTWLASCNC